METIGNNKCEKQLETTFYNLIITNTSIIAAVYSQDMSNEQSSIVNLLHVLINKIYNEHEIQETKSINIRHSKQSGNNWFGQILEIDVVSRKYQNKFEELSVIAKLAPTMPSYINYFPIRSIFERESYMYNVVIPEFLKIQHYFTPFAQCYGTSNKERAEIIFLKNMTKLGFKPISLQRPIDFEHSSLIIKTCAKLHALSFALRNKKPNLFEEMSASTKENTGVHKKMFNVTVKIAAKILEGMKKNNSTYEALENFIKNPFYIIDVVLRPGHAGEYGVITHGDYQVRNILCKYNDESKPTDLCLLDWQLSGLGSPCYDISFFTWVCTDKKFRDQHYFDLLELYYDTLSTFLRQLGCDPEQLYPKAIFENHLKQFSLYGLYASLILVAEYLAERTVVSVKVTEEVTDEAIFEMFAKSANDAYFTRMYENLEDFVKYGYILSADK